MTARWTLPTFAILSLLASERANALCDSRSPNELYERAIVVADTVVEDVRSGDSPGQVVASVRVVRALKGAQPGDQLKVMSFYNQSEMIRFPDPGTAFHLRAVGGPDVYRTNECLYFSATPSDGLGWCNSTICQNLRLPGK